MSNYINKVILKGRIADKPSIRQLPSTDNVANFSVATRSGEHTEWHKVSAYKALADHVHDAFDKGDLVFIEAEIRTRTFLTTEDKNAGRTKPRSVTELIAHAAHLVERRGAGKAEPEQEASTAKPEPAGADKKGGDPSLPQFI